MIYSDENGGYNIDIIEENMSYKKAHGLLSKMLAKLDKLEQAASKKAAKKGKK